MKTKSKQIVALLLCLCFVFSLTFIQAPITKAAVDFDNIDFSSSKDYYKPMFGSTDENLTLDNGVIGFNADGAGAMVKDEYSIRESGDRITYIGLDVKSMGSTKPIYIYTAYQDEKNYSYIHIVQGSTMYYTAYNVVNGLKSSVSAANNIPQSTVNFYEWTTAYVDMLESGKVKVSFYQNDKLCYTITYNTTVTAEHFVLGLHTKNTVQFKNITLFSSNPDNYASIFKEAKKFNTKYEELSRLKAQTYSPNYDSVVDSFFADYNALSKATQLYLKSAYTHAKTLLALKGTGTAVSAKANPTDTFTEDFENGYSNWIDATANNCTGIETVYDDTLKSNVLKLTAPHYRESGVTLKSMLNSPKTQIKSISYKVRFEKMPVNKQVGPKIIYSYTSSTKYNVFNYFAWPDTQTGNPAYNWFVYDNGSTSAINQNLWNGSVVPLTEWFDVSITYNGATATVQYKWYKDTENEYVLTYNCTQANPVEASVMLAAAMNGNTEGSAYYDDVTVTYDTAKVIDEDTNEEITVYYTGNTAQYSDDVVLIQGEDLYQNVNSVSIAPVANTLSGSEAGYVKQMSISSLGKEGKFTQSSAHGFDTANEKKLNILQPDEDSFKILIPSEFKNGIYALKLTGDGNKSKIIYINRPSVKMTQGDEGKISTSDGYIQLIGENLALSANEDFGTANNIKVQFKNAATTVVFDQKDIEILSAYSLKMNLNGRLAAGEYEVMVYNGFGDDTCWSEPYTVTVGASPRDSWPTKVYNIKDYGATGNLEQNTTPYLVRALSDIAANGGGVLYLPKGQYIVTHTLVIPENVTIKGDGKYETIWLMLPDMWEIGDMPSNMMYMTKNVEIKDVAFYATRMPQLISFIDNENLKNENIYFHDCTFYAQPFAGNPTGGNLSGTSLVSAAEQITLLKAEGIGQWFAMGGPKNRANNIRIYNNWLYHGNGTDNQSYWIQADYTYFCGNKIENGCYGCTKSGRSLVFTDNEITAMAHEVTGYGAYVQNLKWGNVDNNNGDTMTADHTPERVGTIVSTNDDYVYTLRDQNFKLNELVGYQVYIYQGPNKGQVRIITANSGSEVRFEEPLALKCTSESKFVLRIPRQHQYYLDSTFYNASSCGHFSGCADVVYDGFTFDRMGTIYQHAEFNDCNFYISYVNNKFINPYSLFNYGYAESSVKDWCGYCYIEFYSTIGGKSLGHTFRRNSLEGYQLKPFGFQNQSLVNMIIEDNIFTDTETAIYCRNGSSVYDLGGFMLYKNVTDNVGQISNWLNKSNANEYGSKLFMSLSAAGENGGFIIGDVNGDGRISVKDCTYLLYALSGKITLSSDQLKRGDINNSGVISLKDIASIKNYILFGTFKTGYKDTGMEIDSSSSSSASGGTPSGGSSSSSSTSGSGTGETPDSSSGSSSGDVSSGSDSSGQTSGGTVSDENVGGVTTSGSFIGGLY